MALEGGDVPSAAEGESQKPIKKINGALKIHGMRSAEIFAKDPRKTRCRRTDGRRWRCSRDIAGPDERYCSAHLIRMRPERARARSHQSGLGEPSAEGIIQRLVASGACPLQGQVMNADQFALLQRLVADNGAQRSHDVMRNPNDALVVGESNTQRQLFHPSSEEIVRFPVTRFHRHSTNCREDLDMEGNEDSVWRSSLYNSSDNAMTTLQRAPMENFNLITTFGRPKTEGSLDVRGGTSSDGWEVADAHMSYMPVTPSARQLSNPEVRQTLVGAVPQGAADDVRRYQSLPALQVYTPGGLGPSPLAPQRAPAPLLPPQPQASQDGSSSTISTSTSRLRFSHDGEVSGRPIRHHHPYATFGGGAKVGLHTFSSFPLERGGRAAVAGPVTPDASLDWASTLDTEGMYTLLTQHSQATTNGNGIANSGVCSQDAALGALCMSMGAVGADASMSAGATTLPGMEAGADGMSQPLMSIGPLSGHDDMSAMAVQGGYGAGLLRVQAAGVGAMGPGGGSGGGGMRMPVSPLPQGNNSFGSASLFGQGSVSLQQASLLSQPTSMRSQPGMLPHTGMLPVHQGGMLMPMGAQPGGMHSLMPSSSAVSSGSFPSADRSVGHVGQQSHGGMAGLPRQGGDPPMSSVYDMLRGYGGMMPGSGGMGGSDMSKQVMDGKLVAEGAAWAHTLQGVDKDTAAAFGLRQEMPRAPYSFNAAQVAKDKPMPAMQQQQHAMDADVATVQAQALAYGIVDARDLAGHAMMRPESQSLMQSAGFN